MRKADVYVAQRVEEARDSTKLLVGSTGVLLASLYWPGHTFYTFPGGGEHLCAAGWDTVYLIVCE